MIHRPRRAALVLGRAGALRGVMAAAGTALLLAATASTAAAESTVQLRGTVYTFDNQGPLAGATVRIQELPGIETTSGVDGTYELTVPDGTTITPYAEAPDHHGIHLQTLVTEGRDLERLNFQIPSNDAYNALAIILSVPLDANGDPVDCAVVSTFSTVNVREATFAEFVDYGAHGVAGATASATPALPNPVYFNEFVVPDPSQTESSDDGGVVWTGVPEGVYRLHASHPTTRFADIRATCVPGRLVNANPPWGFYELRPDETEDVQVNATLSKPKLKGKRLKFKVKTSEYLNAGARLTRGKKTLGKAKPPSGAGAFVGGTQKLSIKLKGKPTGKAKLAVSLEDATGNERLLTKRVKLPKP